MAFLVVSAYAFMSNICVVKRPVVSFFTSKEDVERAIHKMLKDNGPRIDRWLKNENNTV